MRAASWLGWRGNSHENRGIGVDDGGVCVARTSFGLATPLFCVTSTSFGSATPPFCIASTSVGLVTPTFRVARTSFGLATPTFAQRARRLAWRRRRLRNEHVAWLGDAAVLRS